jgi:serine/threonine protein kinase/tetratricopeptide (TPR) repeat protein
MMSLFCAVLERSSADERAAYLDAACAQDSALRRRIDALLRAHEQAGGFLQEKQAARDPRATTDKVHITEGPGTVIGQYKLLEQIGEGGFGVVFLAEQTQPVRRKVALKVLKPGMDTKQVIARFEAERQALALMDHPNIAKVLDGGQTASGRPYFVMDLVKGLPITEYCDQQQFSPQERLGLFACVCQAVQHAHQKGIIHRDLKPSNVLVTVHDTTPVVKVIDFGVAKALGQELTDKTLFTSLAQMIGTPLYMSPEQAGQSGLDVDTRSDIYSLGVLLYELLTGTTPFAKEQFKEAGYEKIRRILQEEDPPKPSMRLSTLGQAASTAATKRRSDPKRLSRLMRGELDWTVMKCLEKDRNRRYETASALAADVQRYLHHEPVLACPPSAWYRFRKFARRNKTALGITSCVLALVIGLTGSIGWVAWDRQVRRARVAEEAAQFLKRSESYYGETKLPEAVAEAQKAQALVTAGDNSADLRQRVRSWVADLTTAARLEEIRLEWYDGMNPSRTDADLARTFRAHGIDVAALPPGEIAARIAGSRIKEDLVAALDFWAAVLQCLPKPLNIGRGQWLQRIAKTADRDPWGQQLRQAVLEKDLPRLQKLVASARFPEVQGRALLRLGSALETAGDEEGVISFLRKAQAHYPGHFILNYRLACNLGNSIILRGHKERSFAEVTGYFRAALAVRPNSAAALRGLAKSMGQEGKVDDAIAAYRQAIRLEPQYAGAHLSLGNLLLRKRDFQGASAARRRYRRLELNPDNPDSRWETAVFLFWCAQGLVANPDPRRRDPVRAVALAKEAIELAPRDDRFDDRFWYLLGVAHYRAGHWKEAVGALNRSQGLGPGLQSESDFFLAMAYWQQGKRKKARQWYDQAVQWMDKSQPKDKELRRVRAEAAELLGMKKQ